jgi:hypothetical protein
VLSANVPIRVQNSARSVFSKFDLKGSPSVVMQDGTMGKLKSIFVPRK